MKPPLQHVAAATTYWVFAPAEGENAILLDAMFFQRKKFFQKPEKLRQKLTKDTRNMTSSMRVRKDQVRSVKE